ncbi:MAG: sporulation transcriptional regulator SpoIIID [Ruminococcus sp.]|nr:sporulation transcriptional regulator SpoIIID [Ruminococcus sp.]
MIRADKDRAVLLGEYTVAKRSTVRSTAKAFGISKSTVHKDLTEKLPRIRPALFKRVKAVLEENKQERHIRGGLATKRKYESLSAD